MFFVAILRFGRMFGGSVGRRFSRESVRGLAHLDYGTAKIGYGTAKTRCRGGSRYVEGNSKTQPKRQVINRK